MFNVYMFDFSFEEEVFGYSFNLFVEVGLCVEFMMGDGGVFFLGVYGNYIWWELEGYFESLN